MSERSTPPEGLGWGAYGKLDHVPPGERTIEGLRDQFLLFAAIVSPGSVIEVVSPTYAQLARAAAEDRHILTLARQCRVGQPVVHLLLAAVKRLVAEEPDGELAGHYASSAQGTPPLPGTSKAFADFCRRRSDEIVALARSERVQTNEVRRCACLMPAFCLVSQNAGGDSLSLIDIGAATGLNLLWDRYRYAYSDGAWFGPPDSTLTIGCEARTPLPGFPKILPGVTHRVGVDLHPIDLGNEDRYRWAMALVWPDHAERARLLAAARRVWLAQPPTVEPGNVVVRLPALIQAAPTDSALCLYHSHTFNQLSHDDRASLRGTIVAASDDRIVYHVSLVADRLVVERLERGRSTILATARCHNHGAWIAWGQRLNDSDGA